MTPVSGQGQLARLVAQGRLGRLAAPNVEPAAQLLTDAAWSRAEATVC